MMHGWIVDQLSCRASHTGLLGPSEGLSPGCLPLAVGLMNQAVHCSAVGTSKQEHTGICQVAVCRRPGQTPLNGLLLSRRMPDFFVPAGSAPPYCKDTRCAHHKLDRQASILRLNLVALRTINRPEIASSSI